MEGDEAETEMRSATILLVEDENAIRALAGRALRDHGYEVLEAADGLAALEVAAKHAGAIDLLLTDVRMPRLDGCELRKRLRDHRPRTKVLFMSGYTGIKLEAGAPFLPKPFTPAILLHKVNELLNVEAFEKANSQRANE